MTTEPNLVISWRSRRVDVEGYILKIEIYRLDDRPGWVLEVVNPEGTSIVWDQIFETDTAADEAFRGTLEAEGLKPFRDDGNVIPFPTRH